MFTTKEKKHTAIEGAQTKKERADAPSSPESDVQHYGVNEWGRYGKQGPTKSKKKKRKVRIRGEEYWGGEGVWKKPGGQVTKGRSKGRLR